MAPKTCVERRSVGGDAAARVSVVAAYALLVESCWLSVRGTFGDNFWDIAKHNPAYVTISTDTFVIFAAIYASHLGLVVAQFLASEEVEKSLVHGRPVFGLCIRWRLAAFFALRALWWPAYASLHFPAALALDALCLAALLSVYAELKMDSSACFSSSRLACAVPIAANASWVAVVMAADAFVVARQLGWHDDRGVGGSETAAMVVVALLAAVAISLALARADIAWAFVTAWSLAGLLRWHHGSCLTSDRTGSPWVAIACGVAVLFVYLAACVTLGMRLGRTPTQQLLATEEP